MTKRKTTENSDSDAVANPDGTSKPQSELEAQLPFFESPPVSPAKPDVSAKADTAETAAEPPPATVAEINIPEAASSSASHPRFFWRPRHKRHALLAASVAVAAAFGAVVGAAATGGFSKPAIDVAAEENKAAQQSLTRLAREVASLKTAFETANRATNNQIAKLSERVSRDSAELTGSSMPAQSTQQASLQQPAPLPAPRPAVAAEPPSAPRLSIVMDWSIRETRDGYVYVQGRGGDIYQVVPGAPLPGLGPVAQIKRLDGRWMVVTPKGVIVSMRDRRYFEQF